MRLSDFDYELPPDRIAQVPADRRDASRLLVVRPGAPFEHRAFSDLPALLPEGALLFVNDALVIPARLFASKPTGGEVELLLVDRERAEAGREVWRCLVGGKKLRPGTPLALRGSSARAVFLGREADGSARVEFASEGGMLAELERAGHLPLPPYIHRDGGTSAADRERYQTVYARVPGAVAAPTAGLHFTPELLAALAARGHTVASLTLHVGPGTFAPVRVDDLSAHVMHEERFEIPEATAAAHAAARAVGRPIVAVGTTVVRSLESAFDPAAGILRPGPGATRLFLRPGSPLRAFDLLVTNFHLPRSTLLMLVAAVAGLERTRAAYAEAIASGYRFFSYGDAMLLWRTTP